VVGLRSAAALLAFAAAGCGSGGTPVDPNPPPSAEPLAVTAYDGVTGAPLTAAGPLSATPGMPVTLSAPGYVERATLLPADGRVFLWPITVDESYLRRIVYETWSFGGVQRLFRWEKATLGITPGTWLPAREEIASTGAVTFVESAQPDVEVVVDPSDPDLVGFMGFTRCTTRGYAIERCRVVVRTPAAAASPLLTHELGHTLGLGHSLRTSDVMHPQARIPAFTGDERVLVAMMYGRRRPGNAPPDDDRALSAQSDRRFVLMIRD
jgi:hypothetical protein